MRHPPPLILKSEWPFRSPGKLSSARRQLEAWFDGTMKSYRADWSHLRFGKVHIELPNAFENCTLRIRDVCLCLNLPIVLSN